ncbi:MAG: FHA domain-containing protein [Hespellia sp.]|nr:FHA domain-containing protein [Hespellia sp.]
MWVFLAVVVIIILVGGMTAIVTIKIMSRSRKPGSLRKKGDNILVRGGMDVRKQVIGEGKGEFFVGVRDSYDTVLTNQGSQNVWRISFKNLKSGEVSKFKLIGKMWIGRKKVKDDLSEWFVISDDPKVSKSHCLIYQREGHLYLRDLNSSNHTYLNSKKIEKDVILQMGDIIRVGDTKLQIEFGRS